MSGRAWLSVLALLVGTALAVSHAVGPSAAWAEASAPDDGQDAAPLLAAFAGFVDARYAQHDALTVALAAAFNADKAGWTDATAEQAAQIPDLSPYLIKSLMIQESGGKLKRDLRAWAADPARMNLPGNWANEKQAVGLTRPDRPNSATAAINLSATVRWLARKSFGKSGRGPAARPAATCDGWEVALQRYNGRSLMTENGLAYGVNYAARIVARAADPTTRTPIPLPAPVNAKG